MLKKIATGIFVTLFSLGLAGFVIAEDDYPNYEQGTLIHQDQSSMTETMKNSSPENDIKKINPLFCTDELVQENATVAKNSCTEEDVEFSKA